MRRVRELHWFPWMALHAALVLVLVAGALAAWNFSTGAAIRPSLFAGVVVAFFYAPWLIAPLVLVLALLRMLADLRWYWFRLCAVLMFGVPIPALLNAEAVGILCFAVAQMLMALLIVQPRPPGLRSDQTPAMDGHTW